MDETALGKAAAMLSLFLWSNHLPGCVWTWDVSGPDRALDRVVVTAREQFSVWVCNPVRCVALLIKNGGLMLIAGGLSERVYTPVDDQAVAHSDLQVTLQVSPTDNDRWQEGLWNYQV